MKIQHNHDRFFLLTSLMLVMCVGIIHCFHLPWSPLSSSSAFTTKSTQRCSPGSLLVTAEDTIQHSKRQQNHHTNDQHSRRPVYNTVLFDDKFLPFEYDVDENVVYKQRATGLRIQGKTNLIKACYDWDENLQTELYNGDHARATTIIQRCSVISPTECIVQWNISYPSTNVLFLEDIAMRCKWDITYQTYNDQKYNVKQFSYRSIVKLFWNAFRHQTIRIPLACIEGTTTYQFKPQKQSSSSDNNDKRTVSTIIEDLIYAQDIQQQLLQNRVCAQDLQFFLEVARRRPSLSPTSSPSEGNAFEEGTWIELVRQCLPWGSVPGMTDPLYIEESAEEDGPLVPIVFVGIVCMVILLFALAVAPELFFFMVGGHSRHIMSPQEMNELISY